MPTIRRTSPGSSTLAGLPGRTERAGRIVALEHLIAQAHETLEASQESTTANNPWARADFDKKAPGVDWGRLLGAAQLGNQQDFVVWQPAAVTKIAALVAAQPLEVWKDWLAFHRINQRTDVLPKAFDDAHFAFYGTEITGQPQQRTRDKRALYRWTPASPILPVSVMRASATRSASATSTNISRRLRRPTSTAW